MVLAGAAMNNAVLRQHKPGDSVAITFTGRTGKPTTATVVLAEDPHIEIVPAEEPVPDPVEVPQRDPEEVPA